MQHCRTEVAQTLVNMEALEKRVGVVEDVLVHAGLREARTDIQKTNEEISTIRGHWEAATVKLQGLDTKVEKVRAQLNTINQELTTKMTDDRVLLMKQSGQVEKVETTLGEIQTTQHALATVMEKIQTHLMKDGDPDETSSVEETPATSEPITSQAGPSGETGEPTVQSGTSFQADLEAQIRKFKAIQRGTTPERTEAIAMGPTFTLTEPVISRV